MNVIKMEVHFMKEITIKDIYSGKPDAKDEINFSVSDEFIKTFVVAEHFNLDSLLMDQIVLLLASKVPERQRCYSI